VDRAVSHRIASRSRYDRLWGVGNPTSRRNALCGFAVDVTSRSPSSKKSSARSLAADNGLPPSGCILRGLVRADASGDLLQEGDQSRVFGCGEPTRADDNLHGVRCRGKETDKKLGDLQRDHSGSPAYELRSAAVCVLVVRKETLVEGRVPRVSDTS
jgi:hypothetical protein